MAVRFANGLFEPIWNRDRIDHVQITVAEDIGIEHRGNFYEKTGALRDMVPNHLFQLVAMTAMEPPASFDADAVRVEKGRCASRRRPRSRPIAPCAANMGPAMVNDVSVDGYRRRTQCGGRIRPSKPLSR